MINQHFRALREFRPDGRLDREARQLKATFESTDNYQGAVELRQGLSSVFVGIKGPSEYGVRRESQQGLLKIVISQNPQSGFERVDRTQAERDLKCFIDKVRESLEACIIKDRYQNKRIHIQALIQSNDGGVRSLLVNAFLLALIDRGIMITEIPVCIQAVVGNPRILVDPSLEEERQFQTAISAFFRPDGRAYFIEFGGQRHSKEELSALLAKLQEDAVALREQIVRIIRARACQLAKLNIGDIQ